MKVSRAPEAVWSNSELMYAGLHERRSGVAFMRAIVAAHVSWCAGIVKRFGVGGRRDRRVPGPTADARFISCTLDLAAA